jgi:hypothetical protein
MAFGSQRMLLRGADGAANKAGDHIGSPAVKPLLVFRYLPGAWFPIFFTCSKT